MLDLKYIHKEQFNIAIEAPISANYYGLVSEVEAPYVAEEVRRYMIQEYGLKAYSEGLEVYTTINSKFQNHAADALRSGLEDYDKRHGFREPENIFDLFPENFFQYSKAEKIYEAEETLNIESRDLEEKSDLSNVFQYLETFNENKERFIGVVTNNSNDLEVLTKYGNLIDIKWTEDLKWARPYISENRRGARPRSFLDIIQLGDFVWLSKDSITNTISLTQIPEAQSALISIDPKLSLIHI